MAVNFGTTNTSRYYTVPDSTDFTLPDGDWTWIVVAKVEAGADPRFLISTNTYGAANSFSLLIASGTNGLQTRVNTNALLEVLSTQPATSVFHVFYVTRRSGFLYTGWKPVGGGAGDESAAQAISGTSDGPNMTFASRFDLEPTRMWRGAISWAAFIPGKALSAAEAGDLATGTTVLMSSPYAAQVRNLWYFQSSTPSTITDSVNSRVATKFGTGYGADDSDPIPPIAGPATKGITLQLFNGASNVGALTGIQAAFFDQAEPKDFLAPVFKTSTATTDSSGNITLNVDAQTALSIGQNGFLVLYKLDGTDHKLSPALATRATIVDIA